MSNTDQINCARCGSVLIELSRTVKELSPHQAPQITVTFRCSNDECQEAIDKKTAEVKKQRIEREEKLQERNALKKAASDEKAAANAAKL
ncbi:hypothetical protein A2631_01580 [Candidatus Daviesbacteria bacterium RIFCSPHIGHO2_01_FULL_44_29]|uniref:Uncharacterized protein n=1 Tax=Candidatus Daviesbacteria bacterium RIFCSPHIGHO2_02_FULL_43_12 TaxID=1797776 RepID=A0A1F5KJJ1_9BACT|nr:MAG: hypothetical protein A2631_01580 [Candidatus Daviesbacteria bacterium RIFCSPHIGHO2_01_FULL_44_29]OGE39059.1 MAG: hypothetical protein A3E86_00500 [Candidatus Daviesbacteria bacterium RIFCSPHIGHO2_12_FULL_47_45]OGE41096.1 MAG: hypothetical protein A3D25_00975 [Candidatus Daviesbacteria bacterium RIFCSPHIGHO2_02_FULL_43_12]OGE69295.1 MAG: hypothetical protein A3B55_02715 [Candidatus Daviesbacteria bacterium RIFCSPLOWO2_01_FULL_43_15]